jgi:hypothetical protein
VVVILATLAQVYEVKSSPQRLVIFWVEFGGGLLERLNKKKKKKKKNRHGVLRDERKNQLDFH